VGLWSAGREMAVPGACAPTVTTSATLLNLLLLLLLLP
jgi:hypothetical protein